MNNVLEKDKLKEKDFQAVLKQVQRHMAQYHANLLKESNKKNITEQLRASIKKYLVREHMVANDCSLDETVDWIMREMTSFSVLDPYLDVKRTDIEEININAWNDVKVHFSDGSVKSIEHFFSPEHCENIVRRLLSRESTLVLDKSRPIVRGHLNNKIRITVMGEGVIDKNIGIAASIRIVNPKNLGKQDFIEKGTANEQMITLLVTLFLHGNSMCITGETGSGKTTFMNFLLQQIPDESRIFTIEEDVREFNLIKTDQNGTVSNNVVHTVTRKSDDPVKEISQERLLEAAMTMDPDVICVAEMKGREAFAAEEAAITGHTVITTTHADSCRSTYYRMADLCQTTTNIDYKLLVEKSKSAFPIVVFVKKCKDKVRRILEITECIKNDDGSTEIKTLFRYRKGKFEKVANPSLKVKKQLEADEVPQDIIDMIFEEVSI